MKRPTLIQQIRAGLAALLRGLSSPQQPIETLPVPSLRTTPSGAPQPITRRVSLIIYNPTVHSQDGRKLTEVMRWNDPDRLIAALIEDLREVSHGYANYEIVERIEVDDFPLKQDKYKYTAEHYIRVMRTGQGIHQPDAVDYHKFVADHQLVEKVRDGLIDEVWAIMFPWGGFFESRMCGPEAFWCNAPPLPDTQAAGKRFVIMCFNYERGVGEMLESYGHRAESIMEWVFRGVPESDNLWKRFIRYDLTHPGQAEVGNIHFAPNSRQDYEWGNPTPVPSRWRTWRSYPDLSGRAELTDCRDWGNGDIREHHRWWFRLLPHITGTVSVREMPRDMTNNWWEMIVDPNRA